MISEEKILDKVGTTLRITVAVVQHYVKWIKYHTGVGSK